MSEANGVVKVSSHLEIGFPCRVCGGFIAARSPHDTYPCLCEECARRIKKLIYPEEQE